MWWWCVASLASAEDGDGDDERGWIDGKPGKGITLHAPGDAASVNLKTRFQVRATEAFAPEEDPTTEVLVRRARLTLAGHAFDPSLTYQVQYAMALRDEEPDEPRPLLDAYADWAAGRDLQVRVGQMIVPFSRQRINSSSSFELVDRSIVVTELNLDRDVGVQLHSDDLGGAGGLVGYGVGVFGGEGRNRLGSVAGYLVAGRVVLRPMGGFDDQSEADLKFSPTPKLAVGVSGGYNLASDRVRSTTGAVVDGATFDYRHAGGDVLLKWSGLSLQGELVYRSSDEASAVDGESGEEVFSRSGWGWFAQSGQMLTKRLGLAERYGHLYPLAGTDPELVEQQELGGGASWYFHAHAVKLQTDWFYLTGATFEQGRHEVRTELQLTI